MGAAIVAVLALPASALAGGFAAPSHVHHGAAAGGVGSSAGLAIVLAVIAVVVLCALVLGRAGTAREQQVAKRVRRKPAGIGS